MSKLVGFNTTALQKIEEVNTKSLDDFSRPRSEMATASELCGCFRKAVMKMKIPTKPTAKELRQRRRGHIFEIDQAERFVAMGFREVHRDDFKRSPGPCFARQVIVEHPRYPIGAHLDFVIKHKDESIHLIEGKTTDGIPWEPYGNWVDQILLQLGLLQFGYENTVIRGSILVADLSAGEEKEFNSFAPPNRILMGHYEKKGLELVDAKAGKRDPDTLLGILCDYCPYRPGCQGHEGAAAIPDDIMRYAEAYERLVAQKDTIEAGLEVLRNDILAFTGMKESFSGQQGEMCISTTVTNDSTMVDSKKLKADLPDIYKKYSKKKNGSVKLSVKRIKPAAPAEEQKKAA